MAYKFGGQVIRQSLQRVSFADIRLKRQPRQLHEGVFLRPAGLKAFFVNVLAGSCIPAGFVPARYREQRHGIPHAEGAFMAEQLRLHRQPVQGARHDLE